MYSRSLAMRSIANFFDSSRLVEVQNRATSQDRVLESKRAVALEGMVVLGCLTLLLMPLP